jgi:hypothetical protein
VLDREEFSGAADAGLDFVGDEQRAVFAAQRAAPGRNSSVGMLTPLPWIGSTMKAATCATTAPARAREIVEGIDVQPGSSGSKPARKFGIVRSATARRRTGRGRRAQ